MNRHPQVRHAPGFLLGLAPGLRCTFAPKIGPEIRKRVAVCGKDLGDTASEYCHEVSPRVVDAVEELTRRGQKARDAATDVIARGAHEVARSAREVERFADAAKAAGKP